MSGIIMSQHGHVERFPGLDQLQGHGGRSTATGSIPHERA